MDNRMNYNNNNYASRSNSNSRPQRPQRKEREVVEVERPVSVNLHTLLEAGSHFGTNTVTRHPKMSQYIYGIRNDVYIIDLEKTLDFWEKARDFLFETISNGGDILFVGTKRQVKEVLKLEANNCGAHFVNEKWLGGALTNLDVIRKTILRLDRLEKMLAKAELGDTIIITKKEKLDIEREVTKLTSRLGGLRSMKRLPSVIFVTDAVKDHIAIEEARKMRIPIIAISDTDSNPDLIDYPIPSNDDGTSALSLFVRAVADTVLEGKRAWADKKADIEVIDYKLEEEFASELDSANVNANLIVQKKINTNK